MNEHQTYLFPSFASVATLVSKSDMLNFDVLSLSGCVDKSSSQLSPGKRSNKSRYLNERKRERKIAFRCDQNRLK